MRRHRAGQPPLAPIAMTHTVWPQTSLRTAAFVLALSLAACSTPAPTVPRTVSMASVACQQPPYPAEARRTEAAGTTQLEFEVNALGKVTRVAVVISSGDTAGHKVLDALALDTISKCAFPAAPGFLPAQSKVAYVWRLTD